MDWFIFVREWVGNKKQQKNKVLGVMMRIFDGRFEESENWKGERKYTMLIWRTVVLLSFPLSFLVVFAHLFPYFANLFFYY